MTKTPEEIRDIVQQMTLEEKIRCCALYQDRFGNLPRLGIAYRSCDNPSGGWCDYFRKDREEMKKEQDFWGTCFTRRRPRARPGILIWLTKSARRWVRSARTSMWISCSVPASI